MSRLEHQTTDIMNEMYDSAANDNFDSVSDYTDRVSGVVDNDYDRNDNDKMPYDTDNDEMPYDNDYAKFFCLFLLWLCIKCIA